MQKFEFLCKSANDKKIVFDPINSHTATHFNDAPKLRSLAEELFSNITLEEDLIAKEFDMGRIIGDSDVVEIDGSDEIVYAMRKSREDQGYVPFTKSRPSQPSQIMSIYLVRKDDETYELSSTWIGEFDSPAFPQMDNATEESIPYWQNHAFVWGSQETIPGTEITNHPW